jgi:hypothetical protein
MAVSLFIGIVQFCITLYRRYRSDANHVVDEEVEVKENYQTHGNNDNARYHRVISSTIQVEPLLQLEEKRNDEEDNGVAIPRSLSISTIINSRQRCCNNACPIPSMELVLLYSTFIL